MRKIERIFVHCTASSQKTTVSGILAEFRQKGWRYPGYHYLVSPDGTVTQLLDEKLVSNGVQGFNATSINVAYIGGIRKENRKILPVDNRTPEQKAALRELLAKLHAKYPEAHIMGHRSIWGEDHPERWKKACPCFNAVAEYNTL